MTSIDTYMAEVEEALRTSLEDISLSEFERIILLMAKSAMLKAARGIAEEAIGTPDSYESANESDRAWRDGSNHRIATQLARLTEIVGEG